MALNPAKQGEALNSPVERASKLNDPQFENQQGYFPYDLTHSELITPLFGQITPSMHLDTVPGDRTVVRDNSKLILNQINGNFLSTLNQYNDSFYVPLRNVFPNNYEKLMPNPVKGDDLPNSALPVVPLYELFYSLYRGDYDVNYNLSSEDQSYISPSEMYSGIMNGAALADFAPGQLEIYMARVLLLATIISRGQLLDYLGMQFDDTEETGITDYGEKYNSYLQVLIDELFDFVYQGFSDTGIGQIEAVNSPLATDTITRDGIDRYNITTLSEWRSALSDIFESGKIPLIPFEAYDEGTQETILDILQRLFAVWDRIFPYEPDASLSHLSNIDALESMSDGRFVNIGKVLAYQQVVAHYYSNDHVDNIFSSELFMQNLRSVMYPTTDANPIVTKEPTFEMNGVRYEYDYISYGGFWSSLISGNVTGNPFNRQYVFTTLMFLLRRSLRYGDYFSTARTNLLAVSDQLGINVENGMVSPIDVTKNLLLQRYLNSVNYVGMGFLQYMSSIFGIKPSDTGCIPRFISHRKIVLQNQITNNTANDQGKQTTNLVGYSDASAFDVFIDDFGYLLTLTSFDVLPIYTSGIENTYHFSDRFDYFNPMLQGIGDQPIRTSEIIGDPTFYDTTFGYTMRNAEYKYKLSKAHGAFVNSLPGYTLTYPMNAYLDRSGDYDTFKINPDFIRDKPAYLDNLIKMGTGVSPANYFHFIIAFTNQVHCARKIQATPGVLF